MNRSVISLSDHHENTPRNLNRLLRYTNIEPSFWKVFGYRTCSYHTPAYLANSKSFKFGTSAHFWPHITFWAWVTRKNDQNFNTFILENYLYDEFPQQNHILFRVTDNKTPKEFSSVQNKNLNLVNVFF